MTMGRVIANVPNGMMLTLIEDRPEKVMPNIVYEANGSNWISFMTSLGMLELGLLKFYDNNSDKYYRFKKAERRTPDEVQHEGITENVVLMYDIEEIHVRMFTFGCGQMYNSYYVEAIVSANFPMADARELMYQGHGDKWSFEYTPYEWYHKRSSDDLAPTRSQATTYGYKKLATLGKISSEDGSYKTIVAQL